MTPALLVVDTNIVCAALISASAESPVCRILAAVRSGRAISVLSQPLLEEYRRALMYQKLARIHGLNAEEVDALLCDLVVASMWVDPRPTGAKAPDPGDQHLWDLLYHDARFRLVTGDRLLLANAPVAAGAGGARVLTARDTVTLLQAAGRAPHLS